MEPYDIVSDIGGTNVRFAQVDGSKNISSIDQQPLTASSSFAEAFQSYCQGHGLMSPPQRLAVGAAGPVRNGQVQLTNAPWRLKRQDLAALSATGMAYLVNDLQAVARAVPVLGPEDVEVLRGASRPNHALLIEAPALAINIGTGFGAASVRKVTVGGRDSWVIGATEAGHMRSAISVAGLSGHATVENFLSGDGLLRVAREMAGSEVEFESSKAVFEQADGPPARDAVRQFSRALGAAVSNLILAHAAWSGVYLVGSVVDGWAETKLTDAFFDGFDKHSPMAAAVGDVPIYRIVRQQTALLGLSHMLDDGI